MMSDPPSKMLGDAHKEFKGNKPSDEQLTNLAKKTLLTTEHVKM